jgi:hypothetical protein
MDLTKADDLASALQTLVDMIAGIVNVTAGMADAFRPFAVAIKDFLVALASGDEETQIAIGKILALAKAVEMAGLAFVGVILAIDEYKLSILGMFNVLAGGVQVLWNVFQNAGLGIQGLFVKLEGDVLQFVKFATLGLATLIPGFNDMIAVVGESETKVSKSVEQNNADIARGLDKMVQGFSQLNEKTSKTTAQIEAIPTEKKLDLDISKMITEAGKAAIEMTKITEPATVTVGAKADVVQMTQVRKLVNETLADGSVIMHEVWVDVPSLTAAQKTIDDKIPAKKTTEVALETARLKEQADTVQKAMEWKAKVDITSITAAGKITEEMFKSITSGYKSEGDLLSSLFSSLTKAEGWDKSAIEGQIRAEEKRREETYLQQKEIVTLQTRLMEAKVKAMERGDNLITVQADGLKPHLEMILWEVLEACQVRANESASDFLLGVG